MPALLLLHGVNVLMDGRMRAHVCVCYCLWQDHWTEVFNLIDTDCSGYIDYQALQPACISYIYRLPGAAACPWGGGLSCACARVLQELLFAMQEFSRSLTTAYCTGYPAYCIIPPPLCSHAAALSLCSHVALSLCSHLCRPQG